MWAMAGYCDNVQDLLTSVNDPNKRIRITYVGRPDALWKLSGCYICDCRVPLLEVVRIGEARHVYFRRSAPRVLLGKSGWGWSGWECVSRVIRRCVPRVIRGRGPYNFLVLFLNLFYLLLWNQGRKDWKNQSFTTIDKGPTNKWSNGSHELLFGKLVAGEKATTQY